MRTVTYRLADLQRASISIGFVGENEYTRVQFDALKVFEEYPSAIPALSVVNPAGTAYPVVVTHDGDYVIWDVQDSDLVAYGRGEAQLTFTSDGVVVKSYVFRTVIDRSIVADGEAPEPVQNWIDEANSVLAEVEEAIPEGGTTGQVLAKKSNADRDLEWVDQSGGGGGTSDYNDLSNKPQIAGTTLSGDKSLADLGIASASDIPDVSGKADKSDTVLDTTLSRGRKTNTTVANGSFAFGYNVEASSQYAHAEGYQTTATGAFGSHAEGIYTKASGLTSHAEGSGGTVSATIRGTSQTFTSEAKGDYSHSEGTRTLAQKDSCHAEGYETRATGSYSHSEGYHTQASSLYAHAEGKDTLASGNATHAEGTETTASGPNAHAEGYKTTASESSAHAEGSNTTASGQISHAEGSHTTASGYYSHAEGGYTEANHAYQHVSGRYNVPDPSSAASSLPGNYIEIIGNGTGSNNKSNARALDLDGNERLKGKLYVECNADSSGGSEVAKKSDIPDITGKADKVSSATSGNFAGLDANGNLTDSGKKASDFATPADVNAKYTKPQTGIPASDIADGVIPDPTSIIDDTAGEGDTDKVLSADKVTEELTSLSSAIAKVTPEQFGAKGDGTTDDSEAVQAACDAGYEVRFADNKTYYLASTVTIDHDVHLVGGKNTTIKTKTPQGGIAPFGIIVEGTLKKTTSLTSNYSKSGDGTNNAGDRFELTDMTGINIGDMMIITATDQMYSYSRNYFYLGGCLLVADVTDDYIWTSDVLPFDITNSQYVTVKIYDAPTVIVDDLRFESDLDSAGEYKYPLRLVYCKNSIIRNTTVSQADNGIKLENCVNTLVDGASISKMPLMETGRAQDHYGLCIQSCTNTIAQRMMGSAANNMIDLTGTIPNINTYIRNCNLFALSKFTGLGMHENAYNTVLEDCVVAGFLAYGTITVNRCRFVRSYRNPEDITGISFRGSHIPEFGRLIVTNCIFDSTYTPIMIPTPSGQDNPTPYHHVIEEVTIENCTGGAFQYTAEVSAVALSNRIKRLTLRNWHNCKEVYHIASALVDEMVVENCQFTHKTWINDHEDHLAIAGISCLRLKNDCGQVDKIYAEITANGGQYYLPANAIVNFASNTQTDIYQVCGRNVASNDTGDWEMGTVGGWENDSLTRTKDNRYASALSTNASGELVWTQPNNSDKTSLYPKCLVYVPAGKYIRMSCKLKNTGNTSGATFRPCLAVVDCATGKITYRNNHGTVTADASGAVATYDRGMNDDSLVLFFLYNSTVVQGSETTISDFVVEVVTADFYDVSYEQYEGSSRVGDGSLLSVEGLNNILVNAAGAFTANLKANMMERQ